MLKQRSREFADGIAFHAVRADWRTKPRSILLGHLFDRIGQIDEIHRLGVQHAVTIIEVVHGVLSYCRSGSRMKDFLLPLVAAGGASVP